jgi:hypothetical protein
MKNPMKTITNLYNKLSNFGKILIFVSLLLIVIVFFKNVQNLSPYNNNKREGFQQKEEFIFKKGIDIYDDFYANIYDYLVFNALKNDYEVGLILNQNVATHNLIPPQTV